MNRPLSILLCLLVTTTALSAGPRPNIILCMADDMGWGDPGYNSSTVTFANGSPHPDQGWISTPTMDAMAANGLRFDRFYSASAVCSPTRASCLTGRNPFRVGVPTANSGRLGFDETPLSEILSAQGYQCGHFGKWHLGSLTTLRSESNRGGNASVYSGPWHHRYDFCFCTESKVPTYHPYRKSANGTPMPADFNDSNWYGTYYWRMPATWNQTSGEGEIVPIAEIDVDHPSNPEIDGDDSKLITDQALGFIQDSVAASKPFFVVLWYHTPHKPVVDPDGTSGNNSSAAAKAGIEDLDTAIGRVRDELTTLGVRGNTMFWVTSDNGPENGVNSTNESSTVRSIRSGRFLERKRSLHEGGVRVPGILEWPDVITSGRSTAFPAITSDYYPTILDYLCLSVPNQKPLDGVSLRPVIEGAATVRAKPIGFKISGDRSWVTQQYKLIDDGSGWELYDLVNIPTGEEVEQTPLATATNLGLQPQPVQDVYNQMLAEFTAWDSTVSTDTPYVHVSQPTVSLTTPSNSVAAPFTVTATFSESVTQLNASEFAVTNGTASALGGSGTTWTVTVSPASNGEVTVHLPEGAVIDAGGTLNAASNQLTVTHSNPSAPDCTLSAPDDPVRASFIVTATFSEDVTGLALEDFAVTNGTAGNFSAASPSVYTVTITPAAAGPVSISVPGGAAEDLEATPSNASNTLVVTFDPPPPPGGSVDPIQTTLTAQAGQTVDSANHVPGDQSNNLTKFTAGTTNDGVANPFTTTLYTRSSTGSEATQRRVRAFAKFDLAALHGLPVSNATLTFNGHSLNDQQAVNIEAIPVAADWSDAGAPFPTFNHATTGSAVGGGSVITGLAAADHTRDYSFDLTTVVQNWTSGTWPNFGLQIRLDNTAVNNGIGIKSSGEGAISLVVEEAPLVMEFIARGPGQDDVRMEWNSVPGVLYRIEASDDLEGPWDFIDVATGTPGASTNYIDVGGMIGFDSRFYRVGFPHN